MTEEYRRRHEYQLDPYGNKEIIEDSLIGAVGRAVDRARLREAVPQISNKMKWAGRGVTVPVSLMMEIPDYVSAWKSATPGEDLAIQAAGTMGRLVGGAGGGLFGGGLGTLLAGPPGGAAGGIAGSAAGAYWVGQGAENAARGIINWYNDDTVPEYPEYPWRAGEPQPQLFGSNNRISPNPYTRYDPEIGFHTSSGYSGTNKGFDSPREMLSPISLSRAGPRAHVRSRFPRRPAS